ncbi:thermonuclease family protein [Sphingobium sufflavum]|uniref:thermonuclease family protein n=1 Tax=Sphingobium sufflavum TaxID=1129547 RepID=UPI001F1ADAAE|nr:thermonuclease family protein [Sphingobium sufflavum]MCE7797673.1 thermonuclease family protein [Sphingobium sufflavum]
MRRLLGRGAVPVLVLLLALCWTMFGGRREEGRLIDAQGRRVFVADGDTLRIGTETVRLAGLDAVERAQFCVGAQGDGWSCGQSAREALAGLVAKGGLRCTTVERDRYGRTVARCAVDGAGDVGAALVMAGWAVADGARYAALQQQARDARRGIWGGTFEAPAVWRERNRVEPKRVGSGG